MCCYFSVVSLLVVLELWPVPWLIEVQSAATGSDSTGSQIKDTLFGAKDADYFLRNNVLILCY